MDAQTVNRRLKEAVTENVVLRRLCEQNGIDWRAHIGGLSLLELRFPHIPEKLCKLWPQREAADYLEELVVHQRPGAQGFPPEVFDELLALQLLLKSMGVFPNSELSLADASGRSGWDRADASWDTSRRAKRT